MWVTRKVGSNIEYENTAKRIYKKIYLFTK